MKKIKVSTVTELIFESESDFHEYVGSDYQARITGFADEIKEAYNTKKQLQVRTARPKIGAVATSYIEVTEIDGKIIPAEDSPECGA